MAIFNSNRLRYRKWTTADAPFLYALNNDPLVLKYTGDPPFLSIKDAELFIESYDHYEKYGYGRWLVELSQTNEPIGWAGIKNQMKTEGIIDLGFRLKKQFWNKGYGSEAAAACMKYGFEKLDINLLTGRAALKNTYSIKILKKLGMKEIKNNKKCHGLKAKYLEISKNQYFSSLEK